jgi:hypothetical protein
VGNLVSGDRVLVARDNGSGDILSTEFTLNGLHSIGGGTVTVNETVTNDHPASGVIRVGGVRYAYTSWAAKVFTLSGTLAEAHANGSNAFVPYIDLVTASTSETVSFTYVADFTARVKVRQGSGGSPIVPFESTLASSNSAATLNAVRTLDV